MPSNKALSIWSSDSAPTLGDTAFAQKQGVDLAKLKGWGYVQKVCGRDVIIAGRDHASPGKGVRRGDWDRIGTAKGVALADGELVRNGALAWLSGFVLIPHAFHQFAETQTLLAGFTTLFALGWLCGDARLRTRSLWMSIGLHVGVVFVKMSFSVLSKRREVHLPWTGRELQIGLVPVGILLLGWVVVVLYTRWEKRKSAA